MCSAAILTDNMDFNNYGPVLLNSALNTISSNIEFFGQCDIKAIRFYNKPLYASEVVNNYIMIDKVKYRIVKIDGNGDIMVVTTSTRERGVFDDRFNLETGENSGINDYSVSRAHESLTTLYNELNEDGLIKQKGT